MMITLLECIKQARWPTDGPLSILPGVKVSEEKKRIEDGTMPPASLVELPTLLPPALEDIIRLFGVPRAHQSSVSVTRFSFTTLLYHPPHVFQFISTKCPPNYPAVGLLVIQTLSDSCIIYSSIMQLRQFPTWLSRLSVLRQTGSKFRLPGGIRP